MAHTVCFWWNTAFWRNTAPKTKLIGGLNIKDSMHIKLKQQRNKGMVKKNKAVNQSMRIIKGILP